MATWQWQQQRIAHKLCKSDTHKCVRFSLFCCIKKYFWKKKKIPFWMEMVHKCISIVDVWREVKKCNIICSVCFIPFFLLFILTFSPFYSGLKFIFLSFLTNYHQTNAVGNAERIGCLCWAYYEICTP